MSSFDFNQPATPETPEIPDDSYPLAKEAAPNERPADPAIPERFEIRDTNSASWIVRRIVEARAYAARVKHWGEREISHAQHDEQFFMMRYGQQLQEWTAAEVARFRGRRRSVNLPAGTVGFRRAGPILVIDNEDAVLSWAMASCPAAVVEIQRISKTALYEHLEKTGEMPEGVHLVPDQDRFYIK